MRPTSFIPDYQHAEKAKFKEILYTSPALIFDVEMNISHVDLNIKGPGILETKSQLVTLSYFSFIWSSVSSNHITLVCTSNYLSFAQQLKAALRGFFKVAHRA